MADPIEEAIARRDFHRKEAERFDAFVTTYRELTGAPDSAPIRTEAPLPPRRSPGRPKRGVGADTVKAAEMAILNDGPMSTRDLLPHITAAGIEVGGNDPIATLSARISGKGSLVSVHGKWEITEKETADNTVAGASAASLFNPNEGDT